MIAEYDERHTNPKVGQVLRACAPVEPVRSVSEHDGQK